VGSLFHKIVDHGFQAGKRTGDAFQAEGKEQQGVELNEFVSKPRRKLRDCACYDDAGPEYHQSVLVAHATPLDSAYRNLLGSLTGYLSSHGFSGADATVHAQAQAMR
jgi:hypothetical protein